MMKRYVEYYTKNAEYWLTYEPWKMYFSLGHIFERREWFEWMIALAEGFFYLGSGLLMFLWLAVRILFYPITRACVVYKLHKREQRRHARKMKKTVDMFHEV